MKWWRTWQSCWMDKRNLVQNISVILVLFILGVICLGASYAQTVKGTGTESLEEHSVVLLDLAAYLIVILSTGLVGIILWNVKDLKNTIRVNHEELKKELKKKVPIQLHNAICEHQIEEEG